MNSIIDIIQNLRSPYRFGFNGQGKVDEIVDATGTHYDFGARIYDSRLGRWLSLDPIQEKYPDLAPYCFVANTPLQAYDPDGRLVIFVNGFRTDEWLIEAVGGPVIGDWARIVRYLNRISHNDRNDYWGNFDDNYMTAVGDHNSVYVDGMGDGPRSLAKERYREGKREAKSLIKKIKAGEITLEAGETIKVVGHSHGAAFAAGMADQLVKKGYTVENYDAFAPHQPNQFSLKEADKIANRRQYSRYSDKVSTTGVLPLLFGVSQLARIGGIPLRNFHVCKDVDGDMGGHYIGTFLPDVFQVDRSKPSQAITLMLPGINVKP